ncbi:ZIP family metal transporter [Pseudoduganella albidiflava]|uniref:ZIP family metal transporter n=1 Tax=Pseudoduganella albidiflava TaxID=321983 RepID=A0A411WW08_9BURK|nr:ZIP family metal transporter [Pseudoduganella albidiflava]QBI00983.1 ZIP family metal transporter [Pseudoduganella albidiflava]GGY61165.1 ZIP family metal transporter [Pseudoduganella albidiflava]
MPLARVFPVWRYALGAAICLGGALALLHEIVSGVQAFDASVHGALMGGATAALATALGTLPVLLSQNFSQRTYDGFLGFGAGVMLAATAFSLVIPAIAAAKGQGAGAFEASAIAGGGILLGMGLVLLLDSLVREQTILEGVDTARSDSLKRAWLFVAAVAIHNLPEGLAIGVAYAGADVAKAHSLATGISIQDVPEGLVVALALRTVGYGRLFSCALGIASGLIEPVAAVGGAVLIEYAQWMLPWGLALAAGAMLFVICHDVIPEAHRHGHAKSASCSVVAGFILMMVLDTALA